MDGISCDAGNTEETRGPRALSSAEPFLDADDAVTGPTVIGLAGVWHSGLLHYPRSSIFQLRGTPMHLCFYNARACTPST